MQHPRTGSLVSLFLARKSATGVIPFSEATKAVVVLTVTIRGWRERSLGKGPLRLPQRWLNRFRRRFLSDVNRCSDALTLARTAVNSSCKDENESLGDKKVFNAETLQREIMSSAISAVSSSEFLRALLSKGGRYGGSR